MPATRSQKAALASPLDTSRKRSVSRAPSAEPAPAPVRKTTTTTTTKRKQAPVEEEEEEEEPTPKKRSRTLKDSLFKEQVRQRVDEKRAAREQQQREQQGAQEAQDPYAHPPKYPSPSKQPPTFDYPSAPQPTTSESEREYSWWKPPHQALPAPETPAKSAPTQQVAQTQPQPARGFLGRLMDTITPLKWRSQTPSGVDTRLPDARIELFQLQEHTKLQHKLNSNLSQAIRMEEQKKAAAAPQHEYEEDQEQADPGNKRKRFANDITGTAPLNVISESPETRFTDSMQTPSRATAKSYNGLVPKSLPRPRRSYKEARAAAAHRGTRNAADPPTPAISRTTPSTPYDKNDYERIRRTREIEQLKVQQLAMQEKLAKLRAEQEAEAETRPRKTKRVKIEHLKEIPHNLPGESSGSFRFPEFDSDDEMEVDEDAEVIDNIFATADDEAPEQKQSSPAKTPTSNTFAAQPSTSLFDKPAPKAPSPVKKAVSPVLKAPSPVKKAPSPMKKAPSPVKEVAPVVEIEDEAVDAEGASSTASPVPTQIFSEASEDEFDIDDEDWPELPSRKEGEPEAPQWWKDEALAKFNKEFAHWQATGEVTA